MPDRDDFIVQMYQEGKTLQIVGNYFQLTRERVRQILVLKGVVTRKKWGKIKPEPLTPEQRILKSRAQFWSNIDISPVPGECWEWTKPLPPGSIIDYPRVRCENIPDYTHRTAYRLVNGLPKLWVLHRCNNPLCCNPDHLYEGTAKDNARDRTERYKTRPRQILNKEEISIIKSRLNVGISVRDIAKVFGAHPKTIYNIQRGFTHQGRSKRRCKLTDNAIRAIRDSKETNRIIGDRFHVHHSTVSLIKRKKRYGDIPD